MKKLLLSALILGCVGSRAAPILQVEDGILNGAKYVEVAGAYYDVEFTDGSCVSLFTGCDDPTDFIFNRQSAHEAAQALLDQILIDTPEGLYNSRPYLTHGCTTRIDGGICWASTPYGLEPEEYPGRVSAVFTWNYSENSNRDTRDMIYNTQSTVDADFQREEQYDFLTYARWAPSVGLPPADNAVSEPGTLASLVGGLLVLFAGRRKLISK